MARDRVRQRLTSRRAEKVRRAGEREARLIAAQDAPLTWREIATTLKLSTKTVTRAYRSGMAKLKRNLPKNSTFVLLR